MPGCRQEQVDYVEAHGTGTRAGDPVEFGALAAVLGEGREPGRQAFVGSLKTNLGHTEAAAGVAGLIKIALALHHDAIPPSLHHKTPNPLIPWADLPLVIPRTHVSWPRHNGPRIAGVSGFGIAGTNAHIVLEEAPAAAAEPNIVLTRSAVLLPLSAKSPEALRALAAGVADLLESRRRSKPLRRLLDRRNAADVLGASRGVRRRRSHRDGRQLAALCRGRSCCRARRRTQRCQAADRLHMSRAGRSMGRHGPPADGE